MNDTNRLCHELVKAQKAFNLVAGGRQSHFTAWSTYSQLVAKAAQDVVPTTGQSSKDSQEVEGLQCDETRLQASLPSVACSASCMC